jgi:UDP-N-acetylmuramoylalanine--D-glutamate ligase
MRHQLGWADLEGRRVGVFGVGVEGRAALARLEGLAGSVVVVDDDPTARVDGYEVVPTTEGGTDVLATCDVVVKGPGISRRRADVRALEAAGIPVVGGVGLEVHDRAGTTIVCVTGTKGKSTTASILGHLLTQLGQRTAVTGNLGLPPFDAAVPSDLDVLVIETSSFQATDVADPPDLVIVTSLGVDHLDWHGSEADYQIDKLSLTSLPGARRTLAQGDDDALRSAAGMLGGEVTWSTGTAGGWAVPLGLVGEHNLRNAELARQALVLLDIPGAEDDARLRVAAEGFDHLPGRLALVGTLDGVRFVDDGLATNVLPTLAALASFPDDRLAILVGGHDRGIDYQALVDALATRAAPTFVVGVPDSGHRLVEAIAAATTTSEVAGAGDVATATQIAASWARPDGVVLLSPAAPSFTQFTSWKERSAAFADAARALGAR